MSRPYHWDPRTKAYIVKDSRGMPVQRKTRTAAGMTYTTGRRAGEPRYSDECLQLQVTGHCGTRGGMYYYTKTSTALHLCPCCQQSIRKIVLNDNGKRRLALLRRLKAARLTPA